MRCLGPSSLAWSGVLPGMPTQDTSWEMCVEDSHAAPPGPGQLICQHADFRGREFGSSASRMSRWQVRAVEFYSHFYSAEHCSRHEATLQPSI